MSDLRVLLDELRTKLNDLPDSATPGQVSALENEARELLAQSKNTKFEDEARELFSIVAKRSAPSRAGQETGQVRGLLRRARIRIEIAGDDQDYDEAIDILAEALDIDPDNAETHDLLRQSAQRSSQHMLKVRGLTERYGIDLALDAGRSQPTTAEPPPSTAETSAMSPNALEASAGNDNDGLLADVASAYYAGDYERTVDLAAQLLNVDPDNAQAQEYKQKSEDNIIRGIVPDHRIPFDARVAYNRANSLVRAGNYEEAERLYRQARDIAEQGGIRSWKDVEQALLEIQDLVLARELLADGDRLLAADDWNGALGKYQGALRVVAGDPEAEDRVDLVKRVQEQFDEANMRLSMISGTLLERADGLVDLLQMLSGLRQVLPGSRRLQQMVSDTNSHIQNVKAQLMQQGQESLTRIDGVGAIEEKYRLAEEARELYNTALQLDATDDQALNGKRKADQLATELNDGRQLMERAAGLIAQNFDNELAQARQMLTGLRHHAQDQRYQALLGDLLARHLERVEMAIDRRDIENANRWLAIAKDDPFRVLGRRSEILRLENEVRALKQRRFLNYGGIGFIIFLVIAAGLYISRDSLEAEFFPTDTPTSTATNTSTATATSTNTPTSTATNTPTNTPTNTNTPTSTPTEIFPQDQTATQAAVFAFASQTSVFAGTATQSELNTINTREAVQFQANQTAEAEQFQADQTATRDQRNLIQTETAAARTQQAGATRAAATQFAVETRQFNQTQTATNLPPTPTPTFTPSSTPTPSATPRLDLCIIFAPGPLNPVNVRSEPQVETDNIVSQLPVQETAEVYEVEVNELGEVWYFIEFRVGSTEAAGWVSADVVGTFNDDERPCPAP